MSYPLPTSKSKPRRVPLQIRQAQVEAGWLGRCFGSERYACLNIAGMTILLLLVMGGLISLFGTDAAAQDYWSIAKSLLQVAGGFVFGRACKTS